MQIDNALLERLESLSKIKLDDSEKEKCFEDIEKIISFMNILSEVKTDDIEALSHAFGIKNVMREDKIEPSMENRDVLKNAPNSENGCFKVPKTF